MENLNDPKREKLEFPKSLSDFFQEVITQFPNVQHDRKLFLDFIEHILKQDPVRTYSLRNEIDRKGLDFKMEKVFPLNDFVDGAGKYLLSLGVSQDEVDKMARLYSNTR